jgi:IS5 family transposase
MSTFSNFAFKREYEHIAELGDRLGEVEKLVDWESFRPIIGERYSNKEGKGGRPNYDDVLMIKMLVLQQWHGPSDPELERQVNDRISFRKFLGFPDIIPDRSTIWLFRERLAKTGKDELIWEELQRQLDEKGLKIREGVIQDATFIHSDPGYASADTPRGEEMKTRRNKDGTWRKKGGKSNFGCKLHAVMDRDHDLIRRICTTTTSVRDSQIDLSENGEVVYRDRGYQGAGCKGYNATMKRGARGHPVGIKDNYGIGE